MPIRPPRLDDRNFNDLVEEALARIPAHTPEWTNPRVGDPGRTLVDLFAWLTDTLLYRANLIPERQRLAFLRLLGQPMRPSVAAGGLVTVGIDEDNFFDAIHLAPGAKIKGPVPFETRSELTVLPVEGKLYYKRRLSDDEAAELRDVVTGLEELHGVTGAEPYATTEAFGGRGADRGGLDLVERALDRSLWIALLAKSPEAVDPAREALAGHGRRQELLSIGIAPAVDIPPLFEEIGDRAKLPRQWEICTGREVESEPEYLVLPEIEDTSNGFARRGVVRLALPGDENDIGKPPDDLLKAGLGDRPPRLDDPETAARLVTWIRLRPTQKLDSFRLSFVAVNAVEVDQRQTIRGRVIGQSDGSADQTMIVPGASPELQTFSLEVEEPERGYVGWRRVDDRGVAGRDDAVYELDSEAGTVRFGDGMRGRVPEPAMRVRVALARVGGGSAGNLPPETLADISGVDEGGRVVTRKLKLVQSLPTDGGEDAESLDEAERRIPSILRHRERVVTESDFSEQAAETPGAKVGRVEVLPRFKPHQRRFEVPGVVSVLVLPLKEARQAPNPRADRPFLEKVHAHLDQRRPLATELYVIGCEYVALGVSVSVTIRDGFGHNEVLNDVRNSLRDYLWSLAPGGPDQSGWPLGRSVIDRELEIPVARVRGVSSVPGIHLFTRGDGVWSRLTAVSAQQAVTLALEPWQLPELLSVVAVASDGPPPEDLRASPVVDEGPPAVGVPVVPEVC